MPNFTLHLGLHKTGTTYLQNTLKDNKDILLSHVFFVPLMQSRKNITPYLSANDNSNKQLAATFIEEVCEQAASLGLCEIILSEENFMGYPLQVRKGLYDNSKSRLNKLKDLILSKDNKVARIVISLREYSEFFESMFLEANKQRFINIESVDKEELKHFSYLDIIEEIKNVFPSAELHVVSYESFKQDNILLFEKVLDSTDQDLLSSLVFSKLKRVSPSIKAYYDSQKVRDLDDIDIEVKNFIHKKLMNSDVYPKSQLDNVFFNTDECTKLKTRYQEDLLKISKIVASVT